MCSTAILTVEHVNMARGNHGTKEATDIEKTVSDSSFQTEGKYIWPSGEKSTFYWVSHGQTLMVEMVTHEV